MMIKVGWLSDNPGYVGGAEMNSQALQLEAPEGVEIIQCKPGKVRTDVDCYVVMNCTQYRYEDVVEILRQKPVYKMVQDTWPHGDERLKRWFLEHAKTIILVTPDLVEYLPKIDAPVKFVPSIVDKERFELAESAFNGKREKACWIGNAAFAHKGFQRAVEWAAENKTELDAYGPGTQRGPINNVDVPDLLVKYEQFVFLPGNYDPCPRTVIEAWFAGCELVINGMVGARYWIEENPDGLEKADSMFWEIVSDGTD